MCAAFLKLMFPLNSSFLVPTPSLTVNDEASRGPDVKQSSESVNDPATATATATASRPPPRTSTLAVTGGHALGKTSLLFQAGVTVSSLDLHVVFICREPFSSLPQPVHGMPKPDPQNLKNLRMMYLPNVNELVKYLATIHQLPVLPDLILIDNLHRYVEELQVNVGLEKAIARICALVQDTANFIQCKSAESAGPHIIVGVGDVKPAQQHLYMTFLHQHLLLKAAHDGFTGDDASTHSATLTCTKKIKQEMIPSIQYRITPGGILMVELTCTKVSFT